MIKLIAVQNSLCNVNVFYDIIKICQDAVNLLSPEPTSVDVYLGSWWPLSFPQVLGGRMGVGAQVLSVGQDRPSLRC